MKWVEFCLEKKYIIFSLVIATILLGITAKQTIPVELFPDTAPPIVNVVTICPVMSAQEVSDNVSGPLEEEFAALDGVRNTSSTSQSGLSLVVVEFHYGTNLDSAAVDTQNAITQIRAGLPANISEPRVQKFSTANRPIMTVSVSSKKLSLAVLSELAENEIKGELQRTNGVAAIDVFGSSPKQISIKLNRHKLEDLGLSIQTIQKLVMQNNITLPGGKLDAGKDSVTLRIIKEASSTEELENLVIENSPQRFLTLGDLAVIEESALESTSIFRAHGNQSIALQVLKKDDANTVEVVNSVKEALAELSSQYPAVELSVASDEAGFTQAVIGNMSSSIMEAMLLAALVILLFLGSLTQSLIVAASMPLTYLGTFAAMKALGLDLNLITLSALILSVGFVIDQTIVVAENIMRHRQELLQDAYKAALEGTKKVVLPLAAGALTTIVVLLPLLFIQGFIGKIFAPLAATMIITLTISFFVSTAIVPLFTLLLGKANWKTGDHILQMLNKPMFYCLNGLKNFYIKAVRWGLNHQKAIIGIAALIMLMGVLLIKMEGMVVLPQFDSGSFIISVQSDQGSSLKQTASVVRKVEELLDKEKEIINYTTEVGYEPGSHFLSAGSMGVNQAVINAELTSRKERKETIWEIEERVRQGISRIPEIDTFVVKEEGATAIATTAAPIDIRITGDNMSLLNNLAQNAEEEIEKIPGVVNLYRNWNYNTPELAVYPKSYTEYGLSAQSIAQQVFQAVEETTVAEVDIDSTDLPVIIDYASENTKSLSDLENVPIITPTGQQVPLRAVADLENRWGPSLVSQVNNRMSVDILGFTHNRTFSFVISDIQKKLQNMNIPSGYEITIEGEQKDLQDSSKDLIYALAIAILGIYLVLLAQFRSFIHPITIMMAIPLVITGVALALLYSTKPISMPVMLGLILLAGTIVNNSILLVDYTVNERSKGKSLKDSLTSAVSVRFRPIMMTATAAIVGMLPLALEWSLGAERFSPLAVATIGGLIVGTLLTMLIIPVIYSLLDRNKLDKTSTLKEIDNDQESNATIW